MGGIGGRGAAAGDAGDAGGGLLVTVVGGGGVTLLTGCESHTWSFHLNGSFIFLFFSFFEFCQLV